MFSIRLSFSFYLEADIERFIARFIISLHYTSSENYKIYNQQVSKIGGFDIKLILL
jgi:hypothetical protein